MIKVFYICKNITKEASDLLVISLPTHLPCKPNIGESIYEILDFEYKKNHKIVDIAYCQYNEDSLPIPYILLTIEPFHQEAVLIKS